MLVVALPVTLGRVFPGSSVCLGRVVKEWVGYREERADRRLGLVSFVNLVRLDDMRSREITGDRIWCAEVDFWRVKILVGWGLVCDGKKRGYVRFVFSVVPF